MGITEDAVKGPVANNNNRPPYNNKKEHVQRFKGEPRLPFMLSGLWRSALGFLSHACRARTSRNPAITTANTARLAVYSTSASIPSNKPTTASARPT